MDVDVFAHWGFFGRVFALQRIAADFEGAALPCVDCSFGTGEGVVISRDEFCSEELGRAR